MRCAHILLLIPGMENDYASVKYWQAVHVLPYQTGWTVEWRGGFYALPIPKNEAIDRATQIAIQKRVSQIAVMTGSGEIDEWIMLVA